jgi:hypothetical protein
MSYYYETPNISSVQVIINYNLQYFLAFGKPNIKLGSFTNFCASVTKMSHKPVDFSCILKLNSFNS